MAVTVTVLDKTPSRLRLQIDNPAANSIGKILRADPGGTRTVRVEAGILPSTAPGLVVLDYEYPLLLGVTVTYTVYSTTDAVLGQVVIDAAHPAFNVETGLMYLTVPTRPASGLALNSQEGEAGTVLTVWDDTRQGQHTVHQVIGRVDPVVVLLPGARRTGSMTFTCPSLLAAQALERSLALPYVFLIRHSDQTLGMYFVPTASTLTTAGDRLADGRRRWSVVVPFAEVGWPTGYVVPITVWTYADVTATYGDYNVLAASFATYADLLERIPA